MVFWMEDTGSHMGIWEPKFQHFALDQMTEALNHMGTLRNREDVEFVSMTSQNPDCVGKRGVDSITDDGKTPDGFPYEWSKQHRAGAMRKR